jgi:hypothetical protein
MTTEQALVKTLDFQLDIQSDNESLLYDACLEARSVYKPSVSPKKAWTGTRFPTVWPTTPTS